MAYSYGDKIVEISKFFVGREKKEQAAFSPLGLLRGHEGVGKTGTERRP
ncbi:hypothetical protein [Arenibacter sp. ARW7G5Y1]|nr:hypothetical protein [Arenibacter sp. ARW7G5Y1]